MEIESVAIIGAGPMGRGIAQVFAQAGFSVLLVDISREQLALAQQEIARRLEREVAKGNLNPEAKAEILARLRTSQETGEAAAAHFVLEAIPEKLELKEELFGQLDRLCPSGAILASNTSSLSIARLAAATARPDKVGGMHFMNPAPVMKLVEVVKGPGTSTETVAVIKALAQRLGKVPVECNDASGFLVNRLLIPMLNEAAFLMAAGVASREDIDAAMVLGANHPLGPLALADLVGLDVVLSIMETLHRELGDDKYRPCPLLREMVEAGHLGRKSGQGFYNYQRELFLYYGHSLPSMGRATFGGRKFMEIDKTKCVGCGNCLSWCTMGAIYIGEDGKAEVNQEECVECQNCKRSLRVEGYPPVLVRALRKVLSAFRLVYDATPDVCPTGAHTPQELEWPRVVRQHFSDPATLHPGTGIGGRGTEEIKTNDVTGRIGPGEAGLVVELGRPGIGARLRDLEKVAVKLAALGVHFEEKNPVTLLMSDVSAGKLRPDVLDEKVLSAIIECKVGMEEVPKALKATEEASQEIDTVLSLGIACRCGPGGEVTYERVVQEAGMKLSPNGKINLGMGRAL